MKIGNKEVDYQVKMTNACHRIYDKFTLPLKEQIKSETREIAKDPYRYEKLSGFPVSIRSYHFSYKGTDYRIAYDIDKKEKIVYVKLINTRENFYEKLKRILKRRFWRNEEIFRSCWDFGIGFELKNRVEKILNSTFKVWH